MSFEGVAHFRVVWFLGAVAHLDWWARRTG